MSHILREKGEGLIGDVTKEYCGTDENGEYKSRWKGKGMAYHQPLIDMGLLEIVKVKENDGIGYASNKFKWLKDYKEGLEETNGLEETEEDEITSVLIRVEEAKVEGIIEKNPNLLFPGLQIIARQYNIPGVGRVDLLGRIGSRLMVIEIKAEKRTSDKVIGQLARYGGYFKDEIGKGEFEWVTDYSCILVVSDKVGENRKLELSLGFIGDAIEVKRYETQIVFS